MPRLSVVISQGQSANPAKRGLEEDLVAALLFESGVEVTVVPNLYDLKPEGTGMLCLSGIKGPMILMSWLFPRAAHWVLDRNGVKGHMGETLLDEGEDDDEDQPAEEDQTPPDAVGARDVPDRKIYCLRLSTDTSLEDYLEEIKRISSEATVNVQTIDLMGMLGGSPKPQQVQQYLSPAPGNVHADPNNGNGNGNGHSPILPAAQSPPKENGQASDEDRPQQANVIEENTGRRWYPVIDYSRCTNCLECLDFCLFGVYGIDRAETILVEQPDNCRKGCPACSRVCPANAIIFPQHKTPAIAGAEDGDNSAFKIDLSKLFGAPEGVGTAVEERDRELIAAGRDAVGATVGVPRRQEDRQQEPKDELDDLMDSLDELDL